MNSYALYPKHVSMHALYNNFLFLSNNYIIHLDFLNQSYYEYILIFIKFSKENKNIIQLGLLVSSDKSNTPR